MRTLRQLFEMETAHAGIGVEMAGAGTGAETDVTVYRVEQADKDSTRR